MHAEGGLAFGQGTDRTENPVNMRIIGGTLKGRRLKPPKRHWPTRPTTEVAREALFNILTNYWDFESMRVLDLFGGMGGHTFEFVSRGCRDVTYVERFRPAVTFVQQTASAWGVEAHIRAVCADVFHFVPACNDAFDYVFADPPYDLPTLETLPDLIFEHDLLRAGGWFVLEHNTNHAFHHHPRFVQARHYGKTVFSIFEMPNDP